MRSDLGLLSDDATEDMDAVVGCYTCTVCGRSIEIYDPDEEEKKDYPYWDNSVQRE